MAYHDTNGKITIDESSAKKDIERLNKTIEILLQVEKRLNEIVNISGAFSGNIAMSQIEKGIELKNKIRNSINSMNESINFINKTVAHYKAVDKEIKQKINSSQGGGFR